MPLILPFKENQQQKSLRDDTYIMSIDRIGREMIDLVPAEIEDSYAYIDVIMAMKHAILDLPRTMTLGRFRYLISELEHRAGETCLLALDPFTDLTTQEQQNEMKYLEKDMYLKFQNLLVMCVGVSGDHILRMPMEPDKTTVPYTDKFFTILTPHGYLQMTFRIFKPKTVPSESRREFWLRQLASSNKHLAPRTMLLLVDSMFPLSIVPGIGSYDILCSAACATSHVGHSES